MTGTWITDRNGTRLVDVVARKKRKAPRAIRFAAVKVGDQLVRHWAGNRKLPVAHIVTDLWFDPVAGQRDETAGRMVAVRHISSSGEIIGRKFAHTLRGLASQGYTYATVDFIVQRKATLAALAEGKVVGIGHGHAIRKRPKTPGGNL